MAESPNTTDNPREKKRVSIGTPVAGESHNGSKHRWSPIPGRWSPSQLAKPITKRRTSQSTQMLFSSNGADVVDKHFEDDIRRRIASMQRRTINPKGNFMRIWDVVMLNAMAWTAIVTPFEISFIVSSEPVWSLFVCNRIIDLIFLADIVLSFFVPYRMSPKQGSRWVYDSRRIARRYLRSWFGLDLFTAIPTDLLVLANADILSDSTSSALKSVRIMKLARLVRLGRLMKRWLSRSTIDPSLLELVKFFAMTVLTAHFLACLWGFAGNNYSSNEPIDLESWYVEAYSTLSWVQKHQLTSARPIELYGVALYVSLSNIFGGPCEISPANYMEFYIQGFMMFTGSSLWAYIIGCGCSILASLSPAADSHRRTIGMLNHYVKQAEVPLDLAARLRTYFNETNRHRYYEQNSRELLMAMTGSLRGETSLAAATSIFSRVDYLRNDKIETAFKSKAALGLTHAVYCAREEISSLSLTIVTRGLVAKTGRIGISVFGEDMILNLPRLRDLNPGMALTLVEVYSLSRETLDELIDQPAYPLARALVNHARVRLTFQRLVMRTAEFAKAARDAGESLSLTGAFDQAREGVDLQNGPEGYAMKMPMDQRISELDERMNARMDTLNRSMQRILTQLGELTDSGASMKRLRRARRDSFDNDAHPTKSVPPPLSRAATRAQMVELSNMAVIPSAQNTVDTQSSTPPLLSFTDGAPESSQTTDVLSPPVRRPDQAAGWHLTA